MYLYCQKLDMGDVTLSPEACQHIKARRLKVGDDLTLFDGLGLVANAKLIAMSRSEAKCSVLKVTNEDKKNLPSLAVGITKIPTLEFILQKATEIGVSEIKLLLCENTPITFDENLYAKKVSRWQKILISACEQSENIILPKLSYSKFDSYIQESSKAVMLHPYAEKTYKDVNLQDCDLIVGPEGGFSDKECNLVANKIRLNTGVLRADTAAIAALLLYQI